MKQAFAPLWLTYTLLLLMLAVTSVAADKEEGGLPFFQVRVTEPVQPLALLLGNVFARKTLSLNGDWKLLIDQLDIGDARPVFPVA